MAMGSEETWRVLLKEMERVMGMRMGSEERSTMLLKAIERVMGECNPRGTAHEVEVDQPWKESRKPYTCDGCKVIGLGSRFRCKKCNVSLHPTCMFPLFGLTPHDLFPGSAFRFLTTPPPQECTTICSACAMPICGFMYHCEELHLDLHPRCRALKRMDMIGGEEFNLLTMQVREKGLCCHETGTKTGGDGWSYVSKGGDYLIHVDCLVKRDEEYLLNCRGDGDREQPQPPENDRNADRAARVRGCSSGCVEGGKKVGKALKEFVMIVGQIVIEELFEELLDF